MLLEPARSDDDVVNDAHPLRLGRPRAATIAPRRRVELETADATVTGSRGSRWQLGTGAATASRAPWMLLSQRLGSGRQRASHRSHPRMSMPLTEQSLD